MGYRGLQRITGGYKGLKGVTGGDRALHGVTKDYRNFFFELEYVEYRKGYFSGLYCLKEKVGKMAIFGPKP